MLLIFLSSQILLTVTAVQFHQYPYVFLLDVGNEEMDATNTEQIKVTSPGGSLALKYPATDAGDTIAHVRVSAVDFGANLRANIIDGGPGHTYVVLVFMGKPGLAYDAVVTIQTVNIDTTDTNVPKYRYLDVTNDSSEDIDDENSETKDDSAPSTPDLYNYGDNIRGNNYKSDGIDDSVITDSKNGVEDSGDSEEINENIDASDGNTYAKYEAFRPGLYGGAKIYPQAAAYVEDNDVGPAFDPENHAADVSSDSVNNDDKYTDSNNNINTDYKYTADY